jgi:parallel beta-helix repeat protein
MRKLVFTVLLLSSAILIAWYIYANILNPAPISILLKNPTVITGKTQIFQNGYYILTDDISCSNVEHEEACVAFSGKIDNFLFDCQGHSITGPGGRNLAVGIMIDRNAHGTVKNCVIQNFALISIFLHHSDHNTIINNTIRNTRYGVYVDGSPYDSIINNALSNSDTGIYVFLEYTANLLIANNTVINGGTGIYFFQSPHDNIVIGNIVNNNSYGIWFNPAYNNTLKDNKICNNSESNIHCPNSTVIDGGNNICNQGLIFCDGTNINCILGCS